MTPLTPGGTPKKDSIFSSIAPAPAPAPQPMPAPAPRPAADADAVAALKQKLDSMERNIAALLDKKLAELPKAAPAPPPAPPPPPPPPPPPQRNYEAEQLQRKMEELEHRLTDFGQAASMSASQLKNIEESKTAARREIGDLLQAVREQQKYSEMDRRMHDQLEKAWERAEAVEKKLMDFYSTVLAMESKRREEAGAAADRSAAAIEALAARLAAMEEKLAASLDRDVAGEVNRAQAGLFARSEEAIREIAAGVKADAAAHRETLDDLVRGELELLRGSIAAEAETVRGGFENLSGELRRAAADQAAAAAERIAEFSRLVSENKLRTDGVETSLQAATRRQALAMEEFGRRLEADLRAMNAEYASAVKKESDLRFEKFGAKYADALLSLTFFEAFRSSLGASVDRLEGMERDMRGILAGVPPEQLERLLGVSGMLVRRKFESLGAAAEAAKAEAQRLREIKREVEGRFKDIFGGR